MKSPNCEIVCMITAALQISISCRLISSFEQPTFIPRRQLKLTSVFHVQDKGRGCWEGQREGPCCWWWGGILYLFGRPGYEPLWRTHWHILNIMKTPLEDLIKGVHECVPTRQEWCHHLQDLATSFIQRSRCWRLCLTPQVTYVPFCQELILGVRHY